MRLAFRWCNGELFESLSAETGVDVEEMVRQMAKNWSRVVRSEAWGGLVRGTMHNRWMKAGISS